MIEAETPDKVLSDDALVDILKADGIDIARRTVAKYREALVRQKRALFHHHSRLDSQVNYSKVVADAKLL